MTIREYLSKKTGKPAYTACVRKKGLVSSRTFSSRSKAEEWAKFEGKRLLRESDTSTPNKRGHLRVREAIELFQVEELPALNGSWASYFVWMDRLLGNVRLRDLTKRSIKDARRDYMNHPVADGGEPLKAGSGNKFSTAISMLINFAIEKEWLADSPMKGWEKLSEQADQRERWLHDDERIRLLEAASKSKCRPLRTIILVAIYTGYRREVIETLRWQSIDFGQKVINVPQKYSGAGKRGKPRAANLPIVPELEEVLLQHRDLMLRSGVSSPFLFPSPTNANKPLDFRSAFETAVKQAQLEDFVFHDLRHSAATYLTRGGADMQVIQQFLGHRNPQMTERYVKRPHEYMLSQMSRALVNVTSVSTKVPNNVEGN